MNGTMSTKRQFYLNALFDVELGGFSKTALIQSAAEMTTLFLPLSAANDTVHLDVDLPDTFLHYLHGYRLKEQLKTLLSVFSSMNNCIVWGWNQQAIEKLMLIDSHLYPSLETVKEVNGRQFCSRLCEKHGLGVPSSYFCTTEENVKSIVHATGQKFPLLLKANFGNAGFGIRVLNDAAQIKSEMGAIKHYLSCGGLVVEQYCERIADLSTSIIINRDGDFGPIYYQHHSG